MHGDYAKAILMAGGGFALALVVILAVLGAVIGWICGRPGLGAGAGAVLGVAIILGVLAWLRWFA